MTWPTSTLKHPQVSNLEILRWNSSFKLITRDSSADMDRNIPGKVPGTKYFQGPSRGIDLTLEIHLRLEIFVYTVSFNPWRSIWPLISARSLRIKIYRLVFFFCGGGRFPWLLLWLRQRGLAFVFWKQLKCKATFNLCFSVFLPYKRRCCRERREKKKVVN